MDIFVAVLLAHAPFQISLIDVHCMEVLKFYIIGTYLFIFLSFYAQLESAVLYDAVFLLHKALETLNARNIGSKRPMLIDPTPLSCTTHATYKAGPNITSIMREVSSRR